ncbi:hypothetical protein H072_10285 [Dactylellina haptotyla CBS 200.50]|uniref:PRELI/MSF1 domain-containing protein n=1 Tax=Dactylellina haptotyla (strain CBS 200.50) TaxID=1284197 RepID=S8BAL8_DACHA|nr:hypothetical protein H072_10285 [Dactylellina haptotyla CBS 200.50]
MVKIYENGFSYDYTWHAVTLAYFLRYPNPYSTHVISSDVISRHIDDTGCLHTVRIHHKRGKLPAALTRLLPSISDSYILETSKVNPRTMVMETETRNLDHTSILSVIEQQTYTPSEAGDITNVRTTVRFDSRFGNRRSQNQPTEAEIQEAHQQQQEKRGLFGFGFGWGKQGVQRTIEQLGARRTAEHVGSSTKGMQLVLDRLRKIGLIGARGVERVGDGEVGWKAVWRRVREEIPKAEGIDAGVGV